VIDVGSPKEKEDEIERKVKAALDTLVDPAGSFYRFGMANSLLVRAKVAQGNGHTKGGDQ
jgi:hypothetical protein